MRLVIIESPFAAPDAVGLARNARYLECCIRDSVYRGESPYASHKMLTGALDDTNVRERALGIETGLAWGAASDATVVYLDLGLSRGMRRGIEHAAGAGRLIECRFVSAAKLWTYGIAAPEERSRLLVLDEAQRLIERTPLTVPR